MAKLVVLPNISVLISIWMETLFYGIYVVLFFTSMVVLRRSKTSVSQSWMIPWVLVGMFCIATAHIGVNVRRLVEGFILPATKAETLAYLYDIHQPLNIAKQYLWVFNNVLADGVMVWRLWKIWTSYVCILPIILLVATTAFGLATASSLFPSVGAGSSIFVAHLSRFATTQYALSLTNNVLVTALIAGRIWYLTKEIRRTDRVIGTEYRRAILLVIDSGALYALTQVLQLAFYVAKFPGLYFVADSFVQIMAIVPTSVVLVVALGRTLVEEARRAGTEFSDLQFTHSGVKEVSRAFPSYTDDTALTTLASGPDKFTESGSFERRTIPTLGSPISNETI
ncbi:hypothetical protein C8Q79DRAFT_975276 [Trametes meyenii]|nr:hypothetical protein C8Q79DRAFT_975276 [Trametes meyenii]